MQLAIPSGKAPSGRAEERAVRRLVLRCWYSLGDIVLLTAAVRDLHRAYPRQFRTDVRTPFDALWLHNPWITPVRDDEGETVECDYALLDESNRAPYHAIHGFIEQLNRRLDLRIRPAEFRGDIHLHPLERAWTPQIVEHLGVDVPYWIVAAGGKTDCTIKWWSPDRWQAVVDHFRGRLLFVQVGANADRHPPLRGVLDLRGRTDVRQLVRLVHHSTGVLCPVTSLMHLAAAVPPRADRPPNRACVVVAGGREPVQWLAYPHHQVLHTLGALRCCDQGGCWKARTVPLGDGDAARDKNLCVDPVCSTRSPKSPLLPACMAMVTPADVIRAVERFHERGANVYLKNREWRHCEAHLSQTTKEPTHEKPQKNTASRITPNQNPPRNRRRGLENPEASQASSGSRSPRSLPPQQKLMTHHRHPHRTREGHLFTICAKITPTARSGL